jgi:hypothetical protein
MRTITVDEAAETVTVRGTKTHRVGVMTAPKAARRVAIGGNDTVLAGTTRTIRVSRDTGALKVGLPWRTVEIPNPVRAVRYVEQGPQGPRGFPGGYGYSTETTAGSPVTIEHNLGTDRVSATVVRTADGMVVYPTVTVVGPNMLDVQFKPPVPGGTFRVTVQGI